MLRMRERMFAARPNQSSTRRRDVSYTMVTTLPLSLGKCSKLLRLCAAIQRSAAAAATSTRARSTYAGRLAQVRERELARGAAERGGVAGADITVSVVGVL
jgi:hypothetical protein